jgi:putative phage-type endonuclease
MESTIEIYSPEWFINRQGNFTGSEIWKLMSEPRSKKDSLSKTAETYILEKVWEKLSGEVKQGINNFATEWGNEHEPTAKKFYTSVTGNEVKDSLMLYSNEIEGLTGSPDGLVGEDGLIEIKCPFNGANHLKHCFITNDETFLSEQPEYYYQMQCYMLLSGRKWCDFVSFDPRIISDLGLFIYRVNANEEVIEKMTEKVKLARELFNQYFESFNGKKG